MLRCRAAGIPSSSLNRNNLLAIKNEECDQKIYDSGILPA